MNHPVVFANDENMAGLSFGAAVKAVQEKLQHAIDNSDTRDPSVKNILCKFDTAVRAFYDEFERRNELHCGSDDEDEAWCRDGSQGPYGEGTDDDDDDEISSNGTWSAASDDECYQHPTRPAGEGDGGERCSICMASYEAEELLRTLPCKHEFHAQCIDEWIKVSNRCPMCKDKHMSDSEGSE